MFKIVTGCFGDKVTLHPIMSQRPNPYGFALIYPETVSFISREWYAYSGSVIGADSAILSYITICSQVSKSRPFPTVMINDVNKEYIDFLESLGIIEIMTHPNDASVIVKLYRKEPIING